MPAMKYFEFQQPYYALIAADTLEAARDRYISYALSKPNLATLTEIDSATAYRKYLMTLRDGQPHLSESIIRRSFNKLLSRQVLVIDGCLYHRKEFLA